MEILLGVGQWKATHVESKEKPNPKPKKTKTLNKIQSSMQGLHYYLELGYHQIPSSNLDLGIGQILQVPSHVLEEGLRYVYLELELLGSIIQRIVQYLMKTYPPLFALIFTLKTNQTQPKRKPSSSFYTRRLNQTTTKSHIRCYWPISYAFVIGMIVLSCKTWESTHLGVQGKELWLIPLCKTYDLTNYSFFWFFVGVVKPWHPTPLFLPLKN